MSKTGHKQVILDHLEADNAISSFEAFERYGITRLSAVIYELKKDGYKICSKTVKSVNRYGRAIKYSVYSLEVKNGK